MLAKQASKMHSSHTLHLALVAAESFIAWPTPAMLQQAAFMHHGSFRKCSISSYRLTLTLQYFQRKASTMLRLQPFSIDCCSDCCCCAFCCRLKLYMATCRSFERSLLTVPLQIKIINKTYNNVTILKDKDI